MLEVRQQCFGPFMPRVVLSIIVDSGMAQSGHKCRGFGHRLPSHHHASPAKSLSPQTRSSSMCLTSPNGYGASAGAGSGLVGCSRRVGVEASAKTCLRLCKQEQPCSKDGLAIDAWAALKVQGVSCCLLPTQVSLPKRVRAHFLLS